MINKIKQNISIYKQDLKSKGLYWSIIHRFYKIPFAASALTPIVNTLKPNHVMIDGMMLYVDKTDQVVSQEIIQSGKWEPYETEIFKRAIRKGDTVLDIGAHIGYYTLIAAKIVGPKGKVYAFEPDPRNFSFLKKSVETNNLSNVVLINKAVSDKTGKLKLYENSTNTGDHRIYNSLDGRKSRPVNAIKLDDLFKNDEKINLIKIDTQGSEYYALKGAKRLILKSSSIKLITEMEPDLLKKCGTSAHKYIKQLKTYGFNIFEINEMRRTIEKISFEQLIANYPPLPFIKANLFANKT